MALLSCHSSFVSLSSVDVECMDVCSIVSLRERFECGDANTAILVNKNHGETSQTTSQHATLDRHDRSIWSKKIKREECDQADLGLLLET